MSDFYEEHPFEETFDVGKKFEEDSIIDIRKKRGLYIEKYEAKNRFDGKKYDLVNLDSTDRKTIIFGIECKADEQGIWKENYLIEIGQWVNGIFEYSGLAATKSKYWLHSNTKKTALFLVEDLRDLLKIMHSFEQKRNKILRGFANVMKKRELIIDLKREYVDNGLIRNYNPFYEINSGEVNPYNFSYLKRDNIIQADNRPKPMRYYLIGKEIAEAYCLELADYNKMTYNRMI